MKLKFRNVIEWLTLLSILAVTWGIGGQWLMLQHAKRECLHYEATSAEMVGYTAYCGRIYLGNSYIVELARLKEVYEK